MLRIEVNKPPTAYPSFADLLLVLPLRGLLAVFALCASWVSPRPGGISVPPMSTEWLAQYNADSHKHLDD